MSVKISREEEKRRWFESGAYVAKTWKGRREEEKTYKEKIDKDEERTSDRGGRCLYLITGPCPGYRRVYSTTARPVPYNVLCNVLAMLYVTLSVQLF